MKQEQRNGNVRKCRLRLARESPLVLIGTSHPRGSCKKPKSRQQWKGLLKEKVFLNF